MVSVPERVPLSDPENPAAHPRETPKQIARRSSAGQMILNQPLTAAGEGGVPMIRAGRGTFAQQLLERHNDEEFLKSLGIAPNHEPQFEIPNLVESNGEKISNE